MRSLGRTVIETDEPILQEGTSPDISRIDTERCARRVSLARPHLTKRAIDLFVYLDFASPILDQCLKGIYTGLQASLEPTARVAPC